MNDYLKYGLSTDDDYESELPDTLRQEDLEKLLKELNNKNNKQDDGSKCKICTDWFQYAEPNQEDGTFICRSCKLNPYRGCFSSSDDY